jgi:hypothetical protein
MAAFRKAHSEKVDFPSADDTILARRLAAAAKSARNLKADLRVAAEAHKAAEGTAYCTI